MKLTYDRSTDSLYVQFSDARASTAREVADGVVLDLDPSGAIVGLDIEHASTKFDLVTLDTGGLPLGG